MKMLNITIKFIAKNAIKSIIGKGLQGILLKSIYAVFAEGNL